MANIFGGVEPPAWLQEQSARNAERGQWGALAGTLGAGLLNSFRRETKEVPVYDKETGEPVGTTQVKGDRIGLRQGLFEARMNQSDPMWRLKADAAQIGILNNVAHMESAHALAQERKQELRAWMEDAPALAPWLTATPEKRRDMQPPSVSSQRGVQAVERIGVADDKYWSAKEATELKRQTSQLERDRVSRLAEWESSIAQDPEVYAVIKGMANNGYVTDPNGRPVAPSVEAQTVYNQWAKRNDKPPFGLGKEQMDAYVQAQKAVAAKELATQNAANASNLQAQRDEAAMAREKVRIDANMNAIEKRNEFQMKLTEKSAELKGDLAKELLDLRYKKIKERDDTMFFAPPKVYPQPDGSVIITHGRTVRTIPAKKTGMDNLRLKNDINLASSNIKKIQDAMLELEEGSTEYGKMYSRMLDAQLALANIYSRNQARPANASEIQAVAPNMPQESPAATQAAPPAQAPATNAAPQYIFDPQTRKIVPKQ